MGTIHQAMNQVRCGLGSKIRRNGTYAVLDRNTIESKSDGLQSSPKSVVQNGWRALE